MKDKPVCKRCGECCKWWVVYDWMPDPVHLERLKAGGMKVLRVRYGRKNGVAIYIPYRCPQLAAGNRCKLHGEKKPRMCRDYPLKTGRYFMWDGCAFAGTRKNWRKLSEFKTL